MPSRTVRPRVKRKAKQRARKPTYSKKALRNLKDLRASGKTGGVKRVARRKRKLTDADFKKLQEGQRARSLTARRERRERLEDHLSELEVEFRPLDRKMKSAYNWYFSLAEERRHGELTVLIGKLRKEINSLR